MVYGIIDCIIGVGFLVIAILTLCGNTALLFTSKSKKIKEENVRPYAKCMGVGGIFDSIAFIGSGIFAIFAEVSSNKLLETVSSIILPVGLLIGCVFMFVALKKYYK